MLGFIGVLVRSLLGGLAISLPTLVRRLLISFGVGAVVFTGLSVLLDDIASLAFGSLSGIPPQVSSIIGILNIDVAFNIIISAYTIKLTLKTLGGLNPKQLTLL